MRFSKIYRKKRKVPLLLVHLDKSKQLAMSDWIPPTQDVPTREETWFRSVYCSHRCFCGCDDVVRHLAALSATFGFQPGPSSRGNSGSRGTPAVVRGLRALPAAPTNPRTTPCGGDGGRGAGEDRQDDGGDGAAEEFQQGDVEELLDMLEDAE